jgi:hypothetical protein
MDKIYVLILCDEKQNDEILIQTQGLFRYLAQSEKTTSQELDLIKVLDISKVNECKKPACNGNRLGDRNIKDSQPNYDQYKTAKYELIINDDL